jgi:hypothetical protein
MEIKLSEIKVCNNCQRTWRNIPEYSGRQLNLDESKVDALCWECDCGSTLYVEVEDEKL